MSEAEGSGPHDECYACPIGGLFLTMHAAQPEAQEHVMNALGELLRAARALIDAAELTLERRRRAGPVGEPRIRRIDID